MYSYIYPITDDGTITTTVVTKLPLVTEDEILSFYKRQISVTDRDRLVNILIGYSTLITYGDIVNVNPHIKLTKVDNNIYQVSMTDFTN